MRAFIQYTPEKAGFYMLNGAPCEFADSKQISEDEYELQHHLIYRSKGGNVYVVKAGFVHDGASKGFLKRFGKYTNAAILHDALYKSELETREIADELFLEAMKVSGESYWRRRAYYYAVRAAGWYVWKQHSKASIEDGKKYIMKF